MDHEFSIEEIKDAVRAARIYCPGFTEDMFESLMELERHIADSGYLEAVQGLLRLEEEKGISCTEALDTCEKLTERKTRLEREVPELEKSVESLVSQIRQANGEYEQVKKATAKTNQELAQIRSEYVAAEKKLGIFNKRMEKEKQYIQKEVEDCYKQANVTKEEVIAAGRVKAEVESHGFTLELALGLSKEFAGYKNARKELAEGLNEHGSLNKYLDNLAGWCNKERTRVMAEIASLESQKEGLASESFHLRNVLSQLQADIAGEENLRRFYRRYVGVSSLMEHLARWNQVFFVRCNNPVYALTGAFNANSGNAHLWTDKPPAMCPQCGHRDLLHDKEIYQALNWPAEIPLKLNLGE